MKVTIERAMWLTEAHVNGSHCKRARERAPTLLFSRLPGGEGAAHQSTGLHNLLSTRAGESR